MREQYDTYETPVGRIWITASQEGITNISTDGSELEKEREQKENGMIRNAALQLQEYFEGTRTEFSIPLDLKGTAFQRKVWAALCEIPYGETRSYGEIAKSIGNPKAARAVGMANHNNPIVIVVPCHRVIGADGGLTGYGGGMEMKRYLLELEKKGNSASDRGNRCRSMPGGER